MSLVAENVPEQWRIQTVAGWVKVLMSPKAAVDFGVDLRNHDLDRTWDDGFLND